MKKQTVSVRMLSNFMYYIAHTLRTPLNGIRWATELLKDEDLGVVNEEQREALDTLERSTVDVLRLASQLQDAMLILRGEPLQMNLAPCDLAPIVDEVAGTWAVAARRKRIRLVWKHPAQAMPAVSCDPNRARNVLSTIVENTVHYSRPGTRAEILMVVVGASPAASVVRALRLPSGIRNSVVVTVTDGGVGIPTADQKHVFKPFFRARNARDLWADGTGISLALAHGIIAQMGGRMWFTSVKGKGTLMRFSLPIETA